MEIAILGAGHGGLAMSADLTLKGHNVRLAAVKNHSSNLEILKREGKISVTYLQGDNKTVVKVPVDFVKDSIEDALLGADIIFVNVPAFAQDIYNEYILKYGKVGQSIIFPCGGFSAVNCYNYLKQNHREKNFYIGETASFVYTTKITGPAEVLIKSIKDNVQFAAYPDKNTIKVLKRLNKIYPQFYKAENAWITSFNNPSSVLHTITTLLNMSRIEQVGSYQNSYYDITPSIARIIEKVDEERVNIASHFCKKPEYMKDILGRLYNINYSNFYDTIKHITAYKIQFSPNNLKHRYISEDIPYSLVPIATIGKKLGLKTENMDSIINLACMCNNEDYWHTGRNADKIGFTNESDGVLL